MNRRSLLSRAVAALFAGLAPASFGRAVAVGPAQGPLRIRSCTLRATVRVTLGPGAGFPMAPVWDCLRGVNSAPLSLSPTLCCDPGTVRLANVQTHMTADVGGRVERHAEYTLDVKPAGWSDLPPVDYGRLPWHGPIVSIELSGPAS